MAYFHRRQDGIDRAGKVIADILIAIMFLVFSLGSAYSPFVPRHVKSDVPSLPSGKIEPSVAF